MAGMTPLVTIAGEVREVRPRPLTDQQTGEIRKALHLVVLTTAGDELGGFAEVYLDPDTSAPLLKDTAQLLGTRVELVCRAYAVTRNYGTEDRPKFGKALGLSYVSGALVPALAPVASASSF